MIVWSALAMGCGGGMLTPRFSPDDKPSGGNPLGGSYLLVPLPSDDDSLLGRVLLDPPAPGRSLDETARPNPCADKLMETKASPLANAFEDAQELSFGGKARAMLGSFGFGGDIQHATHFLYKLETSKEIKRPDTVEYQACCAEKGCGYGYVASLVYGDGEYMTGEETQGSGGVDVGVVSTSAGTHVKVLHRRKVHGYVAALIKITDRKRAEQLGLAGPTDAFGVIREAGISEATVSQSVKDIYDRGKISVCAEKNNASSWAFCGQAGAQITENEFVRRYRAATGSNDIDDAETNRQKPLLFGGLGLTALGVGTAVTALIVNSSAETNDTRPQPCSVGDGNGCPPTFLALMLAWVAGAGGAR